MAQKSVTIDLSRALWQCLVAMAMQDLREPENFVLWLLLVEARRRGLHGGPVR